MTEQASRMDEDLWSRQRKKEPPGLDEIIEDLFGRYRGPKGFYIPFLIVLFLLLASGFFIVSPAEQAVVLRLGRVARVVGPGPNWMIPLLEHRYVVNTQQISSYNYHAEMLTRDESYADVDVTVFFRIGSPEKFLFNDVDPVDSLAQASASALRQVVGDTKLEGILTDGRTQARYRIQSQLEKIIAGYDNGIEITDVKLQDAKPPQAVRAAFDDVIQAREDYDRFMMDAEAYKNKVIPKAEGLAMRIENAAYAEHMEIINHAHAEIAGFDALLSEYKRYPDIVKNQLFLSTMEEVYTKVNKVFVGSEGNIQLLPLAELIRNKEAS